MGHNNECLCTYQHGSKFLACTYIRCNIKYQSKIRFILTWRSFTMVSCILYLLQRDPCREVKPPHVIYKLKCNLFMVPHPVILYYDYFQLFFLICTNCFISLNHVLVVIIRCQRMRTWSTTLTIRIYHC